MNLKRCSNGHFYDVDKYATCPHCAGASGVDDSMASTVAYGASDATVGYTVPDNQEQRLAVQSLMMEMQEIWESH